MADDAKALSQEDIDALLNSLGGPAEESASSRPAEPAPAASAAVDQAELDRLMAALDESPAPPAAAAAAAPSGPLGQDDIDALINNLGGGEPPAPAPAAPSAAPTGPLGQDDIDALINNLGGSAPAAPVASAPASDGPLGQDDIDALINNLGGSPPAVAAAAPPSDGPMGQDDIDALLNNLGSAAPAAPAPAPASDGPMGQDEIDALLNNLGESAPAAPPAKASQASTVEAPAGQLGQTDIDALVNSLGGNQAPEAAPVAMGDQPTLIAPPPEDPRLARTEANDTAGLSSDVVDALVAKHADAGEGDGEGMIAQSDIDALVKSLGHTGAPSAAPTPSSMTEALARHDDAIDQLLAGAGPTSPALATMDAVDVRAELGKGPGSGPHSGPAHRPTAMVGSLPVDLAGAKWMLLAAVLLLSVCCGTLVVVARAVRDLASELNAERVASLTPKDDYADDFRAAKLRLESPHDEEVAKAEEFLQRLKKKYPSNLEELSLTLGRHFMAKGVWKSARKEFSTVVDEADGLQDDPRVHLDYARTLSRAKDRAGAIRQVNLLLANESAFTGSTTLSRLPRPEPEITANRQVLQEAQLMLGRLLIEDDGRRTVARAAAPATSAPAHGADHGHAPAHGGAH